MTVREASNEMYAAYVTIGDPRDVRSWSGIDHYAAKALTAQSISLDYCGPLEKRYERLLKGKEGIYRYLLRRRHPRDREPLMAKHYARQIMRRLRAEHNLVFAVGTIPISFLECEQPIVAWTDATFAASVDFYPAHTNLASDTIRNGNAMEAAALRRCRLIIYSSDWGAESAISDYRIDPARVAVVPFGANMETDLSAAEAKAAVAARLDGTCRLLFVGVEWDRKGGPRAIEIAQALNEAGTEATLDLVGSSPPRGKLPAFVTPLGFIDKASANGQNELRRLLLRSHFLVLPAQADCSPVVLNEAAAHALPSLATAVGGIPTIVRDEINGKLFAAGADAADYCEYVVSLLSNPGRYRELALTSLEEYRRRLNWRVAGATVRRLLDEVIEAPRSDRRSGAHPSR
jgi:glycosyltransferase involved in cell wall biosynthesis